MDIIVRIKLFRLVVIYAPPIAKKTKNKTKQTKKEGL